MILTVGIFNEDFYDRASVISYMRIDLHYDN